MKRLLLVTLLAAGCEAGSITPGSDFETGPQLDGVVVAQPPQGTGSDGEVRAASISSAPKTIYLNRSGGTYRAGQDDSMHKVSSVVYGQGLSQATIAAAPYSDT